MITAVDTSVLLDVFAADPRHVETSQNALRKALGDGALIACEVVIAELRPWFASRTALVNALTTLGVDPSAMTTDAALLAGEAWGRYRKAGGKRERLIPDFLIAGHAKTSADRLLTRDRGFYRRWFRGLSLIEP